MTFLRQAARRVALACALAASAAGALAPAADAIAAGKSATHVVAIDGTTYVPNTLTVRRGDTVTWVNKDPFPHTVTARGGEFDSKTIAADKSWKYVARQAGRFPYVCALHATMTGTLVVE